MKRLIVLLSLAYFTVTTANAQSFTLKKWNWDDYKMSFQAPDNMEVTESTGEGFKASNKLITLNIYPRKGENLSYDGMKGAIIKWAEQSNLKYGTYNSYNGEKQPFYISDLNRYSGCAIDGTKEDYPASMLLLKDPDYPEISFYIWVSYAKEYANDAVTILRSFKPV
jgi:dihydroorotase-like protein